MIEAIISVSLISKTLCAVPTNGHYVGQCFPVVVGCEAYPTKPGTYNVETIYTNASLVSFKSGQNLGTNIIGSTFISLGASPTIKGTLIGIHGWHNLIKSTDCSHGCIRMNNQDINQLINQYYFNEIIINDG